MLDFANNEIATSGRHSFGLRANDTQPAANGSKASRNDGRTEGSEDAVNMSRI
jgi:hypothetical protein